jgi:hypothetical protein
MKQSGIAYKHDPIEISPSVIIRAIVIIVTISF